MTAVACYLFFQGRNCLILASLSSQVFLFFVLLCRNWFKSIFPWCISCFRVSCASTSQSSSIYTLFFLNMIPNLEIFFFLLLFTNFIWTCQYFEGESWQGISKCWLCAANVLSSLWWQGIMLPFLLLNFIFYYFLN